MMIQGENKMKNNNNTKQRVLSKKHVKKSRVFVKCKDFSIFYPNLSYCSIRRTYARF